MSQRNALLRTCETVCVLRRHYSYKVVRIQPLKGPPQTIEDVNSENQAEALKNAVAPFWNVPYNEQLDIKNDWISYVISQYFSIMDDHLKKSSRRPSKPLPRPRIDKIFPSPITKEYRTRDTFMVRKGIDGNPKTVGQIVGSPSRGEKYICVPPEPVLSPPHHIEAAKLFQDYIRSSPLPACLNYSEGGNWVQFQVRTNHEKEMMALVKIHPQQLTQRQVEDECGKLTEFFKSGPGSVSYLSSLYFQACPHSNASGKLAPYQLLFGEKYLMEKLNGRDFALSPASFFQSNRRVAEIMYDKIFRAARLSQATSILDLGCGIGTISILAAPLVRSTVGIDLCEEAIEDAKYNASLNNIHSANFVAGYIGRKLSQAVKWVEPSSDVVAILNPGRCGVEVSVIKALRESPQIGRVIYVACQPNHEWVLRNVLALIKPEGSKCKGQQFTFKSVTPVDMFPLTTHCELIMTFER